MLNRDSNPGLESRFNRYLFFEDYTVEEMLRIFEMRCNKSSYQLEEKAKDALKAYFLTKSLEDPIAFGNARGVRNTFEKVLVNQANRLAAQEKVGREDLMQLTEADVLELLPPAARPAQQQDAKPEETAEGAKQEDDRQGAAPQDAAPQEDAVSQGDAAENAAKQGNAALQRGTVVEDAPEDAAPTDNVKGEALQDAVKDEAPAAADETAGANGDKAPQ